MCIVNDNLVRERGGFFVVLSGIEGILTGWNIKKIECTYVSPPMAAGRLLPLDESPAWIQRIEMKWTKRDDTILGFNERKIRELYTDNR